MQNAECKIEVSASPMDLKSLTGNLVGRWLSPAEFPPPGV